MVRLHILFIGI